MGRVKRVRHHVNPLSDLTQHKFDGFDNDNPIIVDVGADRGEFSEKLIQRFGDTKNFIILEIRKPLAKRLKVKFSKYDNVVIFDGNANRNFEQILRPSINKGILIEKIYINFPDPWFKKRHKKRRVINEKFLEQIKNWIQPQTKWIFQTDQKQLFKDTVEMLENLAYIEIEFFDKSPYDIITKWEKAKIAQGFKINRIQFNFL
jgi:tRNA (guanine-N7-)-methyltransferase